LQITKKKMHLDDGQISFDELLTAINKNETIIYSAEQAVKILEQMDNEGKIIYDKESNVIIL